MKVLSHSLASKVYLCKRKVPKAEGGALDPCGDTRRCIGQARVCCRTSRALPSAVGAPTPAAHGKEDRLRAPCTSHTPVSRTRQALRAAIPANFGNPSPVPRYKGRIRTTRKKSDSKPHINRIERVPAQTIIAMLTRPGSVGGRYALPFRMLPVPRIRTPAHARRPHRKGARHGQAG